MQSYRPPVPDTVNGDVRIVGLMIPPPNEGVGKERLRARAVVPQHGEDELPRARGARLSLQDLSLVSGDLGARVSHVPIPVV